MSGTSGFTPGSLSISALVCRKCAAVVDILYSCVGRKNENNLKHASIYLHYGATFMIFPECAHIYSVFHPSSSLFSTVPQTALASVLLQPAGC